MVMVEQIAQAESVGELRAALWQTLMDQASRGSIELQRLYDASRERISRFLRVCESLPALPEYREGSPRAGLDDGLRWCDKAERIIEQMPASFDPGILTDFIDTLTGSLGAHMGWYSGYWGYWLSNELWRVAAAELGGRPEFAEAVATLQKQHSSKHNAPRMTLNEAIRVKIARQHSVLGFARAIERRCRELDPAYVQAIERVERHAAAIAEHLDQLWQSPAGSVVAAYDVLTGSKIRQLLEQARFESFDAFAMVCMDRTAKARFCEPLGEAIKTFKGFCERVGAAPPIDQVKTAAPESAIWASQQMENGNSPQEKAHQEDDMNPPTPPVEQGDTPKSVQVKRWAEGYIRAHEDDKPTGFNALLRLVKENIPGCKGCSPRTLRKAIDGSPALRAWEEDTKREADNKKRASKPPKSLEGLTLPSHGGHSDGVKSTDTPDPEEEARLHEYCEMSYDKLLVRAQQAVRNQVKWQSESGAGPEQDFDTVWQKIVSTYDISDPRRLGLLCMKVEDQIGDLLRHDPKARNDSKKRKYLPDVRL